MTVELRSKAIVIIDDEPDICEALELALGLEGYRVTAVTDRDSALELISETEPAIILLDYRMPGRLEPQEFIDELRHRNAGSQIVLMTAGKDPGERARELGLNHYLSKPFELDAMLEMVRKCMAQEGH